MCFKYIGYDLGLQFFTCLNEAAIGLCGTVGCSLCPSCDHAAAPGRSQGSGFELLFNIPGWVFYVGMGVLVRRARHQIHTLVQSAFFPINKTWSSGAELLLEKGANHTKIQYYTPCRQNRYIPLEGIGLMGWRPSLLGWRFATCPPFSLQRTSGAPWSDGRRMSCGGSSRSSGLG